MAKSGKSGGAGIRGGRSGRVAPSPNSIAGIMAQRAAFRANAPKPRDLGRFELLFGNKREPLPIPKYANKTKIAQIERDNRSRLKNGFVTIDFLGG
jgi:hypothetical protein